ncbi:MAG: diaminopimelate decarboxylase, partial [Prevotellaceae bacterium]|nr:diaminopimelate decarboxylase [Prevotellaceae bacterium]
QLRDGQQVHFELGRSVVAQCGALISRVLYVKHGHKKDFVIVDAGMSDLLRPALYGSEHQARNLSHPEAPCARFDIVGPICESSDVFLSDYTLPSPQRGDLIAFKSAGAYGEIMASGYNCRQLPESWID